MQVLKAIPYVFFSATILLLIPLLTGLSDEFKTFGVKGKVSFEGASSKGALVILTTSDENPFENSVKKDTYFEQYLQESGHFYRKINELGGEDINIWIKQAGYPIVQVNKVFDISQDYIDFNKIQIPAKLKKSNQNPIEFFKDPCEDQAVITVVPAKVATVRNFSSLLCEKNNLVQFKADEIDLIKGSISKAVNDAIVLSSDKLASVVF